MALNPLTGTDTSGGAAVDQATLAAILQAQLAYAQAIASGDQGRIAAAKAALDAAESGTTLGFAQQVVKAASDFGQTGDSQTFQATLGAIATQTGNIAAPAGAIWTGPVLPVDGNANSGRVDPGQNLPAGFKITDGPGTFYSPFNGEIGSFPPDVQYDLFAYWLRTKFAPPPASHWENLVFGAEWDQWGSDVSNWSGGPWGQRTQKVTAALLGTYGDIGGVQKYVGGQLITPSDLAKINADLAKYDGPSPVVLQKTTRQCFVEGYGWRYLHAGPSVGDIFADVGIITAEAAVAALGTLTGGALTVGAVAALAGTATGLAGQVASDVQKQNGAGAKISGDASQGAQIFAIAKIPLTPPIALSSLTFGGKGITFHPFSAPPTPGHSTSSNLLGLAVLGGLVGLLYFYRKGGK